MNREESLELYEKGVEAWNAWAKNMLARKAELEENNQWQIDQNEKEINQVTSDWVDDSIVDFSKHTFTEAAVFENFIFPYIALFRNAEFIGNANFDNATFGGNAIFNKATFNGDVGFEKAIFSGETFFIRAKFCANAWLAKVQFNGNAKFESAEFEGNARFHKTTFSEDMLFDQILFKGFADFSSADFKKKISFIAIHGNGYFSFKDTRFYLVPDFNQAHFIEAPQFDNSDFSKALNRSQSESEGNISSNWRALKRLAIQGHDHERELIFFAAEIKSQRGKEDKALPNPLNYFNDKPVWPGGSRYWFGYFYQWLSDFGRSVMRPIFWLLVLGFLFQVFYLKYSIDAEPQETVSCDRTEAAIYLSVRNALPFLPATGYSENLSRSYACLYGKHSDGKEKIPNAIVFISIVQTILSTILIFLLLLALRNHFKIK